MFVKSLTFFSAIFQLTSRLKNSTIAKRKFRQQHLLTLEDCAYKNASNNKGGDLIFFGIWLRPVRAGEPTVLFASKVGESLISMSFVSFLLRLYPLA